MSNTKVKLQRVRMAFPNIFTPNTPPAGEGKPSFGASLLIEPGSANEKAVEAAIEAAAKEKWGAKAASILASLRKTDKVCLHDGDNKEQYAGFAGMMYVSARNPSRPTALNKDKTPLTEADGVLYAGCYVNAVITLWAQDNKFGKRVNATLGGVQFCGDGDAFSGAAPASADEFDDLSTDEEDDLTS